jgi:hypothetical protein
LFEHRKIFGSKGGSTIIMEEISLGALLFVLFTRYYYSGQIKEGKTFEACSTYGEK